MSLFDKDNPGKNLSNATLWLDSAEESSFSGSSGDGGCLPGGCLIAALLILCIVVLPAMLITCASGAFA